MSGTGTVSGSCNTNVGSAGTLTAGNGLHYQSGTGNRAMGCTTCTGIFVSDLLQYQLYTTAAHTTIWNATNSVSAFNRCNRCSWSATVYGGIFAAVAGGVNDSAVGTYSDTVLITLNY